MNYGIPYKGSKNRIAEKLVAAMPSAETFVDLFAGGCAVTHAAILSGKYKRIIINDIDPMPVQTFIDAARGKFLDEKQWISREEFHRLKNSDGYVRYCFSFGNGGMDYAFAPEREPYTRAGFNAIMHDDWTEFETLMPETVDTVRQAAEGKTGYERWLAINRALREAITGAGLKSNIFYKSFYPGPTNKRVSASYNWLPPICHLNRLNSLSGLDISNVEIHTGDYRAVNIPVDSVVYCDIPYRNSGLSKCYGNASSFDFETFYNWARSTTVPIFISEKSMPDGFINILETQRAGGCFSGRTYDFDRLYIPDRRGAA